MIAADIIKQLRRPVPCLTSPRNHGRCRLTPTLWGMGTRYHTRMKRRAIATLLQQHATIALSSKWPITTPVVPGIIKMSVGR
jgi:hypothetical protein